MTNNDSSVFDFEKLLEENNATPEKVASTDLLAVLDESAKNLPQPSRRLVNSLSESERLANKLADRNPTDLLNGLHELNLILKLHQSLANKPDAPLIEDLFDEIVASAFDQVDEFTDHFRPGKNNWEKSKLLCLLIKVACEEKFAKPDNVVDISSQVKQILRYTDTTLHRSSASLIERNMDVVTDPNDVARFVEAEMIDKFLKLDHSLESMDFITKRSDKAKIKPIVIGIISNVLKEVSRNVHNSGLTPDDVALSYRSLLSRSNEAVCAIIAAEFKNGIETQFDEKNTKRICNEAVGLIKSVTIEDEGRSTLQTYRSAAQKMYERFALNNGATESEIKASQAALTASSISQIHRINLNQLKVLTWDLTTRQIYQGQEVTTEKSRLKAVLTSTCGYAKILGGVHSPYIRAKCAEDLMYRACQANRSEQVFDPQSYLKNISKICESRMFPHFSNAVSIDTKLGHIENSQAYMAHTYLLDAFLDIPVKIQNALKMAGFESNELEELTQKFSRLCIKKQAELEPASMSKFSVHHALMLKRSFLKFCGDNFADTISRSIPLLTEMMSGKSKLNSNENKSDLLRRILQKDEFLMQLDKTLYESHAQAMRAIAPYATEIKDFAFEERMSQEI